MIRLQSPLSSRKRFVLGLYNDQGAEVARLDLGYFVLNGFVKKWIRDVVEAMFHRVNHGIGVELYQREVIIDNRKRRLEPTFRLNDVVVEDGFARLRHPHKVLHNNCTSLFTMVGYYERV